MQEGTLALMQLAKTVAALERLRAARVPYVSVMTDPTTGGVFASYAVLGDVNLAEPNALIGFAGARVTAGTIAQELPSGFQRSEFLFEHGFVDRVVHRSTLRAELAGLLHFLVPIEISADQAEAMLPAFRPLSFLTALAERVIPEQAPETNGDRRGGDGPHPATQAVRVATAAEVPSATERPMLPAHVAAAPVSPATPPAEKEKPQDAGRG
jgi:acetyl-CoA carboxylase carboxyl transferase subunit beta